MNAYDDGVEIFWWHGRYSEEKQVLKDLKMEFYSGSDPHPKPLTYMKKSQNLLLTTVRRIDYIKEGE
jgi:hypothetical protein